MYDPNDSNDDDEQTINKYNGELGIAQVEIAGDIEIIVYPATMDPSVALQEQEFARLGEGELVDVERRC